MFSVVERPKVISVEGYKAFYGIMRWNPGNPAFPAEDICGEWLYKPDVDCWYCRGSSYPAEYCEILEVF